MSELAKAYVQIIPTTKGIAGSLTNLLSGEANTAGAKSGAGFSASFGKALAVGAGAITAGATALTALGKSAVDAGREFDDSMAQVAATMGLTIDEMNQQTGSTDLFTGNLREFAEYMGATTAFSAVQAADALNYMALAGYDVQTSMEMLPNVLNLAAAGAMDLATASDMVTDVQTALGLSLEQTDKMVDEMAKTSSKSNTSVEQLGEAMLRVGANAKMVVGGTEEITQMLGLMADNGIKGAEAGTHLRNILLAMTPKSTPAADWMERLEFSAYDAEGALRPLPDIFQELGEKMKDMSDETRTDALSSIFNKTDLAAVSALLDTTTERYDELRGYIEDAEGAAQAMANTQLDSLQGDMTLFTSALEGAQIAISDRLTPTLRSFVEFGTDGLSQLTLAFQQDGLTGAMESFGTLLSDGLAMLVEQLPTILSAGASLVGTLVQGILENLPMFLDTISGLIVNMLQSFTTSLPEMLARGREILGAVLQGIIENLPELLRAGIEAWTTFVTGMYNSLPELIPVVIDIINGLVDLLIENIDTVIDASVAMMTAFAEGVITSLPILLEKAPQILIKLGAAMIEAIPHLLRAIGEIITSVVTILDETTNGFFTRAWEVLKEFANSIWTAVKNFFEKPMYYIGQGLGAIVATLTNWAVSLGKKIAGWFKELIGKFPGWISDIKEFFRKLPGELLAFFKDLPKQIYEVGKNVISGLWSGVTDKWNNLKNNITDFGEGFVEGFKNVFKIGSPSKLMRDEIGQWIPKGIAVGIEGNTDAVTKAMDDLTAQASHFDTNIQSTVRTDFVYDGGRMANDNSVLLALLERYLPEIANDKNVNISLEGDAKKLFEAVRQESTRYTSRTGKFAFG